MHVVVDRLLQARAQQVVVDPGGVVKTHVVHREGRVGQRLERDPEGLGVQPHRRVHRAGEAVEEAAVDAALGEQLAHQLQRVHRVLHRLGREAVHQVGVHQHPGVGEALGHAGHLLHRHALGHQGQQAVGRHLQAAGDRDAAAVGQLSAQLGREGLLEADVAPPADAGAAALQLGGQGLQRLGRRGLVDEVEAGLAGLGDDGLDAVDQHLGRGGLVARDVVQADVAEAALLPVAAVGHRQLVPAPVAPQPVHRVEHVQQRQVAVQRQPVPGRRAHLVEGDVGLGPVDAAHRAVLAHEGAHQARAGALAAQVLDQGQQRALAAVQGDEVDVVEQARLAQLAQLGVDEAAAQGDGDRGVGGLDRLGDAQRRVQRARERHRQQHQGRAVRGQGLARQARQGAVDQVGRRGQGLGHGVEAGLAGGQLLGIAHELEARVHRLAHHVGQVVQVQRGQVLGAVGQAQHAEGPGQRVAVFLAADVVVQRGEARALGQQGAGVDAVRQHRVAPLQEADHRADGGAVGVEVPEEVRHLPAGPGLLAGGVVQAVQALGREQVQHQAQRQVGLGRGHPARAQETGQVGGGRVRRVELRHRRDDAEHAHLARRISRGRGGHADRDCP